MRVRYCRCGCGERLPSEFRANRYYLTNHRQRRHDRKRRARIREALARVNRPARERRPTRYRVVPESALANAVEVEAHDADAAVQRAGGRTSVRYVAIPARSAKGVEKR